MVTLLNRTWWSLLLRGLAALVFGAIALFRPQTTVTALVLLFGVFALVEGFATLAGAWWARPVYGRWWLGLLAGLAGVILGLLAFLYPQTTAVTLLVIIGVWALVSGVFDIINAVRLRREVRHEWLLMLRGIASVAFGLAVALRPGAGAIALAWAIGVYALVIGALLIALAFRVRGAIDAAARIEERLDLRP